jgi:hypothetical protein
MHCCPPEAWAWKGSPNLTKTQAPEARQGIFFVDRNQAVREITFLQKARGAAQNRHSLFSLLQEATVRREWKYAQV